MPTGPDPLGRAEMLRVAEERSKPDAAVRALEPLVHEWVWTRADSERWWLEPRFVARLGHTPGKDLKRRPSRRRGMEEYGYDEAGRLLLARRYVDESRHETLLVEHGDGIALARTYAGDVTAALRRVARMVIDGGRVVLAEHAGGGTSWFYWLERFRYDAQGRLRTVEFERSTVETRIPTAPDVGRGVQRLTYAGDELVGILEEYDSGWPSRVIRAPVEGTAAELARLALGGVIDAIREAAKRTRPDEPMCMLALRYVAGGPPLPPIVDLCADAAWPALAASGDPFLAMNPAEWHESELALELGSRTAGACANLERVVAQDERGADLARRLALTAAALLRDDDWAPRRAVTDDFLVYAVDVELADLEANCPPARLPRRQRVLWQ